MRHVLTLAVALLSLCGNGQYWEEYERSVFGSGFLDVEITPTGERFFMGTVDGPTELGGHPLQGSYPMLNLFVAKQAASGEWSWAHPVDQVIGSGTMHLGVDGELVVTTAVDAGGSYLGTDLTGTGPGVRVLHLSPLDGSLISVQEFPSQNVVAYGTGLTGGWMSMVFDLNLNGGLLDIPNGPSYALPSQSVLVLFDELGELQLSETVSGTSESALYVLDEFANGDLLVSLRFNQGPCTFLGTTFSLPAVLSEYNSGVALLRIDREGNVLWATEGAYGGSPNRRVAAFIGADGICEVIMQPYQAQEWAGVELEAGSTTRFYLGPDGGYLSHQALDAEGVVFVQLLNMPGDGAMAVGMHQTNAHLGPFMGSATPNSIPPVLAHLADDGTWDQAHFFMAPMGQVAAMGAVVDRSGSCLVAGLFANSLSLNGIPFSPFPGSTFLNGFTVTFGANCMSTVLDSVTHASCSDPFGGGIALHELGGEAPYTWTWSDGATGPVRSGLATGLYQFSVEDGNGCSATGGAFVQGPQEDGPVQAYGLAIREGVFRPATDVTIRFIGKRNSCTPANMQLRIALDPQVDYLSGLLTEDMIIGDTLVLDLGAVSMQNSQEREVVFVTDEGAQIGDEVCFQITVISEEPDNVDPRFDACFAVVNSYDPNDKAVIPRGSGPEGAVDIGTEKVQYLIRFQNTGSAPAFNVHIDDTLAMDLDLADLEVLDASHTMDLELLEDRLLRFRFDGINLPDSVNDEPNSHGYIAFQVPIRADAPVGTQIRNTAHIFFDLNPAVVTNTTVTTLTEPVSVREPSRQDLRLLVAPNPALDQLTIITGSDVWERTLVVYDEQGREVLRRTIQGERTILDVSSLSQGSYTIRSGERVARFVRVGRP